MSVSKKDFCKHTETFNKKRPTVLNTAKIFKNIIYAGEHTNMYLPSKIIDTCTGINIWKYEVIKDDKLITSENPITTTRKYKKNKDLPQIISCSLFGSNEKYVNGLFNMLKSLRLYGLDKTWDIRVYVASRRDGKRVNLSVSKKIQKKMLKEGIELAHVDNGNPNGYSLEGTFWRFLSINEKARILVRDVDWIFTGQEIIAISEWIESGLNWHRMLNFQLINTPLLAGQFGVVGDQKRVENLHSKILNFPYKKKYGDDEFFTMNYIFIEAVKEDSILTHYFKFNIKIQPFKESSFFPTNKYIKELTGKKVTKQKSFDLRLPDEYGIQRLIRETNGFDDLSMTLKDLKKYRAYFLLSSFGKRGEKASEILNIDYF